MDVKLKRKKTDLKNNHSSVKVVTNVLAMHIQYVYVMIAKYRLDIITITIVSYILFQKTFFKLYLTVIFITKND